MEDDNTVLLTQCATFNSVVCVCVCVEGIRDLIAAYSTNTHAVVVAVVKMVCVFFATKTEKHAAWVKANKTFTEEKLA